MANLEGIITSPEQKSAEFWQRASEIMVDHGDLLQRKFSLDGEESFLVTPSFTPTQLVSFPNHSDRYRAFNVNPIEATGKNAKKILGNSYAIAAQVDKRKGYKPGSPLYLIINDQITKPLLKFDRNVSRLVVLDGSYAEIEGNDHYIDAILSYIDRAMEAKEKSIQSKQDASKHKKRGLAGVAAGLAIVGSAVWSFAEWRQSLGEEERQTRAEFDGRNVDLGTVAISAGQTAFVEPKPILFVEDIPKRARYETLEHPRRFEVDEGTCSTIDTLNPLTQAAEVVADAPQEQMYVAVNSDGRVQVCAFETPEDTDEKKEADFDVAVKIVPKQTR